MIHIAPESKELRLKNKVLETNTNVEVKLSNTGTMHINIPATLRNNVCGICGNFDGNAANDWTVGPGNSALDGTIVSIFALHASAICITFALMDDIT